MELGRGGGVGALPSWSSVILRSLFRALCWTSGRLEKFCMTSAGDRAAQGGLGSRPICEPPPHRHTRPGVGPRPYPQLLGGATGPKSRVSLSTHLGGSTRATHSRPPSQRVMGFNRTQLSTSKAHNREMGSLGS